MNKLGILLSYLLSTIFFMANISEACEYVDVCKSGCSYSSIQTAIDYVECSDNNYNYTIRVAVGTYSENINITKCSGSPYGAKNITIEGGWDETFTYHVSERYPTLVDGGQQGRVFYINPEGSYLTITIKDLTIQNGKSSGFGGGIFAETTHNYNLFLILLNNEIKNNKVEGQSSTHGPDGGGIAIDANLGKIEATLKKNKIHHNSAEIDSGGILFRIFDSDITLTMQDNEIYENKAWFGGGVVLFGTKKGDRGPRKLIADLSNNTISNNYVTQCQGEEIPVADGGGILIEAKGGNDTMEITLNNNTIENNQAALGAGISVRVHSLVDDVYYRDTQVRLRSKNNTIINNIIPDGSKGLDCSGLIRHPNYPPIDYPDTYYVTGGGVAMIIDKDLTKQSVLTFDNDLISGNTLDDLALETGDRDKAFIGAENSIIAKMGEYGERAGDGSILRIGDLILDITADNFNDGNYSGWTVKSGTWRVENREYSEESLSSNAPAFSLISLETQDMSIEVKGKDTDTGVNKNFFIVFAYDEANAKAYWAGARVGQDKWTIEETDLSTGESWPPLAGSPVENIETNTWYDLKVEVNGNTVTLYAKKETETDYGNLKVTYTFNDPVRFPNGIPRGDVGLGGRNNHAHFDDFNLTLLLPVANPSAPLAGSPVRIVGSSTEYKSLQDAYDAAVNGNIIQSQAARFMEDLYIDINKSVTLEGGYDCDYNEPPIGKTILNGNMTISDGTVTIENFIIQ